MTRSRRILEHAPGVYEIPSLLGGSIRIAQWVVVGSDGAALIDTGICGTPAEVIAPALEEVGLELGDLTTIVLSHCDVDHIGGTAEIVDRVPDIVVAAPAAERELIESWERLRDERYRWVEPYGLEVAPETEKWLEQAFGEPFMITRPVADGDHLGIGDVVLEVVGLPGHSDGLVGVWLADAGVLIAMDAVFGTGPDPAAPDRVNPPQYGAVDRYLAAIDRIGALAPRLLGASHFEPLRGPTVAEFLRQSRAFVDDLDQLLQSLLTSEPRSLSDLTDAVSAVLGPFRPDFHELTRSVCAHLRSLEESGSAARSSRNGLVGWKSA
jgi:glyoxylase-like metal-dependent hydrolase (beta-lactamase superfamily II)